MPGMHGRNRAKISDYGVQLREKQKMKRIYGMMEKSFNFYFRRAAQKRGVTGETLIQMVERRLDNVVYRLRWASSRAEARQFVSHAFVFVNGRNVNIPSFFVKEGDQIEIRKRDDVEKRVRDTLELLKDRPLPEWLSFDPEALTAKVLRLPTKADAGLPVEESMVVELYSK